MYFDKQNVPRDLLASVSAVFYVPCADPIRAESNDMLSLVDIQELLGLEVLGLIPESKAVLTATNLGQPVIMAEGERTSFAAIARRMGTCRFRFYIAHSKGAFLLHLRTFLTRSCFRVMLCLSSSKILKKEYRGGNTP